MYTIKINTFEKYDSKINKRGKFKESLYFEGENVSFKEFFDDSKDGVIAKVNSLYEGLNNIIYINDSEDAFAAKILGFITPKEIYQYLAIFNDADIFILQNGKTIDKISV